MFEEKDQLQEGELKVEEKDNDRYFVGVKFNQGNKSYFFHTDEGSLKAGEKVVVETIRGLELGETSTNAQDKSELKTELALKPVIRRATESDIQNYTDNLKEAAKAMDVVNESILSYNLEMRIIDINYTLDGTKIIISYISENRVDFRELLKDLASKLKCRIELRQIGTRDRSKVIGGVAICGLPLCCSTFLTEFDGISINMAKNQCLVLNIQKLSGHCGKLICCLKYEDDEYSNARKGFPRIGQKVIYEDGLEYKITGFNVIAETARLENRENIMNLSIKDVFKYIDKGN